MEAFPSLLTGLSVAIQPMNLVFAVIGVFLGSIGFPVIYTLSRHVWHVKRWSLHAKLTLATGGDIAQTVAFLASEGAAYITGQTLGIDGSGNGARHARLSFLRHCARFRSRSTRRVQSSAGMPVTPPPPCVADEHW